MDDNSPLISRLRRASFKIQSPRVPDPHRLLSGYCQQMDIHLPETTVREALLFSANLRRPADVPAAEKAAYAETCLKMCGLEKYADAIVGSLEIEQRKRTTIAVELAAKVLSIQHRLIYLFS